MKCGSTNKICFSSWFILMLAMGLVTVMKAQPGNPEYSLSTSTFFEVDIQPIAVLDIETSKATTNFAMDVDAPTEAGEGFGTNPLVTNTDNWINYSSGVPAMVKRKIQVSISSGTMPSGFELKVAASSANGSGGGVLGTPIMAPITLSGAPQDLILAIRGAFTGDGSGNGHQLTFTLDHDGSSFSTVESQSVQINVLYTLMDY